MGWIEHDAIDAATLLAEVAGAVEAVCRNAIAARGKAILALAGGRTPLPVYAHVAAAGLSGGVVVIPTDERCVAHTHPACNVRNLRDAFAADSRIDVRALTREDGDADASLAQALALLNEYPQPFDAVLLGMGTDGHIASLFPGAANPCAGLALDSDMDALATLPNPLPPEAPFARITLTLPRLLRARSIHLVVSGCDKRQILRRAQQEPYCALPVAALLEAAATPIHIHWSS